MKKEVNKDKDRDRENCFGADKESLKKGYCCNCLGKEKRVLSLWLQPDWSKAAASAMLLESTSAGLGLSSIAGSPEEVEWE